MSRFVIAGVRQACSCTPCARREPAERRRLSSSPLLYSFMRCQNYLNCLFQNLRRWHHEVHDDANFTSKANLQQNLPRECDLEDEHVAPGIHPAGRALQVAAVVPTSVTTVTKSVRREDTLRRRHESTGRPQTLTIVA